MDYYYSYYNTGEIYIAAYEEDEYYDDVTICLAQYGVIPGDNQVVIPVTKMRDEDYSTYVEDLIKSIIKIVPYGPYDSAAVLAELKDDWKDRCILMV